MKKGEGRGIITLMYVSFLFFIFYFWGVVGIFKVSFLYLLDSHLLVIIGSQTSQLQFPIPLRPCWAPLSQVVIGGNFLLSFISFGLNYKSHPNGWNFLLSLFFFLLNKFAPVSKRKLNFIFYCKVVIRSL